MASPPARPLSGGALSPSRPPESPTEVLYNTAVQSFVRRDHVKTHSTLSRLLSNLRTELRLHPRRRWYDLSAPTTDGSASGSSGGSVEEVEEWLIKTFKLFISAHASLYTDPPGSPPRRSTSSPNSNLPFDLQNIIPPNPPRTILQHVYDTVSESYPDRLIPPPLITTFILAGLKLHPQEDALECIHTIIEDWLFRLPDTFMEAISAPTRKMGVGVAQGGKRVESGREGYLRVLELFTGEVLAREGEWEMARGILDGDTLLGSKRKEALYRHLRATQKRREAPSSASSSGMLPSPSGSLLLPDSSTQTGSTVKGRARRGRSGSSSTSSSEATARPATQLPLSSITNAGRTSTPASLRAGPGGSSKGKGRGTETDSESTLPSRIVVNPPRSPTPRDRGSGGSSLTRRYLLSLFSPITSQLPVKWRNRVWGMSTYQLASMAIPLPLFVALFVLSILKQRRTRRTAGAAAGTGSVVQGVRDGSVVGMSGHLAAIRREGVWAWAVWFLKWWMAKVAGVWKLGTTISYL